MDKEKLTNKIAELKKLHCICSDEEADDAVKFAAGLLDLYREHLQETEPYAGNTIAEYVLAESLTFSVIDTLKDELDNLE
jgi:hypothetical protein